MFLPAELLVTSAAASDFRDLSRGWTFAVAADSLGRTRQLENCGRKSMPDLNDFAPIDVVRQPVGDKEKAAQEIMRELDELLGVFARISCRIERIDPDAVEGITRVLDDRVENAREGPVRARGDHDFDHRPIHRPEEKMLGIPEEVLDRIRPIWSHFARVIAHAPRLPAWRSASWQRSDPSFSGSNAPARRVKRPRRRQRGSR